jgi:Chloramphenicol O-acetyltransferase
MKRIIDPALWDRKDYFEWFGAFTDPFLGLTAETECTGTYLRAKREGDSVFSALLYRIMTALNSVENFRFRLEKGKIALYDTVHVSPTVARDDGSFGFAFMEYSPDYDIFSRRVKAEIERVKAGKGIMTDRNSERADTVHFTTIPWFPFTDLKHPSNEPRTDSVPKIATGKIFRRGEKFFMPVSVTAHHGFVDGRHVAVFLDRLQKSMTSDS